MTLATLLGLFVLAAQTSEYLEQEKFSSVVIYAYPLTP